MKIKQILYLMSFCLLLSATTFAQQVQEFTVSGTVVDKDYLHRWYSVDYLIHYLF